MRFLGPRYVGSILLTDILPLKIAVAEEETTITPAYPVPEHVTGFLTLHAENLDMRKKKADLPSMANGREIQRANGVRNFFAGVLSTGFPTWHRTSYNSHIPVQRHQYGLELVFEAGALHIPEGVCQWLGNPVVYWRQRDH